MPKIKINDISLNYELDGSGPAIVFINGLTMDVNGWFLQVRSFSERNAVLRYDCRGQGQSDKPDIEYSQEIAQHFTLRYPDRVGALVLVDTCSYIDTLLEIIIKVWIRAAEIGGSEFRYDVALPALFAESFIKRNLDVILAMKEISVRNNPPKPIINLAKGCLKHNVDDRIREIKAPTLIIVGEKDILIPLQYSKILNEKIEGSKLVVIKECGHVPPLEKPEEFNKIVLDFLKDYDGLLIK
jgi:3-oxoadipate enol-lactonase